MIVNIGLIVLLLCGGFGGFMVYRGIKKRDEDLSVLGGMVTFGSFAVAILLFAKGTTVDLSSLIQFKHSESLEQQYTRVSE